jgi:metal-dependent amidase/aminoacylase/carboxypeptidase family protein
MVLGCSAPDGHGSSPALGEDRAQLDADPIMASEDFGILANHVPACLALIGNGITPGTGGTPLHSHDYTFNDDILTDAVAYYRQLIRSGLRADKHADE